MTDETKENAPTLFVECVCGAKIDLDKVPFEALNRRIVRECKECGARFEIIQGEHKQLDSQLRLQRGPRHVRQGA